MKVELVRPNAYLFQTSTKQKIVRGFIVLQVTFNLYAVDTEHTITNTLFDQLPEKDLFFARGIREKLFHKCS